MGAAKNLSETRVLPPFQQVTGMGIEFLCCEIAVRIPGGKGAA